jgi:hypothetical protein
MGKIFDISMNPSYRWVAYFCGNVRDTRIFSEISRSLTPSTPRNIKWRFMWLPRRLKCMSSGRIVVTVDAEVCNVHEQRCEIRRSQKNRGILHSFGFSYLFKHFKQPTPIGWFYNVVKFSKGSFFGLGGGSAATQRGSWPPHSWGF